VGALDVRCSSVRAARNASSCTRRPHTSLSSVSQHQALLPGCLLIQSSVDVSICNQYCWSSGTSRNGSGLRHRRISSCGVARCSTSPAQTLEKTSQPFRRAPSSAAPAQSVGLLALLISPGTMPHRRSQASSICPCHPAGTPGPFLRKRGSSCLFSGASPRSSSTLRLPCRPSPRSKQHSSRCVFLSPCSSDLSWGPCSTVDQKHHLHVLAARQELLGHS
jgi:hypothetical protein